MNPVQLNGVTIRGARSVSLIKGRYIVDGKDVTDEVAKTGGYTAPEAKPTGWLAALLSLFRLR